MRAHIVIVINSRTRGLAPMVVDEASNNYASCDELVEGEDGELYRLEIETARKFSPNPGMIRLKATPKVEEKAEPTKNVFAVGVVVILEQIAEQKLTLTEDPEICTQRKMCWMLRGRRARNIAKRAIGDH